LNKKFQLQNETGEKISKRRLKARECENVFAKKALKARERENVFAEKALKAVSMRIFCSRSNFEFQNGYVRNKGSLGCLEFA